MSLRDQLRILVVDDMATSRGLVVQALEGFGLRHIETAENGAEALAQLQAAPVHLVLSDYNMPGMTGMDLLVAIRGHPALQRLGLILITGRADRALLEKGQAMGLNNYLAKPFTAQDLRRCIEAVVGRL
jgi:Response regulator containing CheY-like receiver domain and AraC-type DNA-binding domain